MSRSGSTQRKSSGNANDLILASKDKIASVLPSHMRPNRIVRMATMEVAKNPDLQKCAPVSVVLAVMDAARLGLEIGRHCHLIPYKGSAQMQPNYQGLCELAYRTGSIKRITTACVFEGDTFRVEMGTSGHIVHIPSSGILKTADRITHAYAAAKLPDDEWEFEVMDVAELEHVRSFSKNPQGPAWKNWTGEMYRKVVLKRLLKRLPSSPELHEAVMIDHAFQEGDPNSPQVQELIQEGREIAFGGADPVWGDDAKPYAGEEDVFEMEDEKE